jgi:phage replication-related protein YjqB (UPF0714/DUF867 family)
LRDNRIVLDELLALPDVEERCVLRSRFGFLALHGGLEQHTAEIASDAAEMSAASFYAVVQPDDLKWHVPSHRYAASASPDLAAFLAHVDVVVSVHGYGGLRGSDDRWTTALVGGSNRALAAELAATLRAALPEYTWVDDMACIPNRLRGVHPQNPVNQPRHGGVQLELPPRIRGYGQFWRDFDGPGFPPHTVRLIETLATIATR